jgi:hypothetical protein
MQLDLFTTEKQTQNITVIIDKEHKYYYLVRFEHYIINGKAIEVTTDTKTITMHAVYLTLEKVNEVVSFIKQLRTYAGWHQIIRLNEMPNLNKSNLLNRLYE